MSLLLDEFYKFIEEQDVKHVASSLGTFPSVVNRWKAKTHTPKLEVLDKFHEKIYESLHHSEKPDDTQTGVMPTNDESVEVVGLNSRIMMMFPFYKTTNPGTAFAMFATGLRYGIKRMGGFMWTGARIHYSRNRLAAQFIASESEWSIWLDDDMIPPIGNSSWLRWISNLPSNYPENFANQEYVGRLLSHNKKLVGGLYFGRNENGSPMFHEGLISRSAHMAARAFTDELRPTEWVATGTICVHRDVFLDIKNACPEIAPKNPKGHWGFFDESDGNGEDVSFCLRAKKAGHQAHVDLGLISGHVGHCVYGPHNTKFTEEKSIP